jgi:hypothetical protein
MKIFQKTYKSPISVASSAFAAFGIIFICFEDGAVIKEDFY